MSSVGILGLKDFCNTQYLHIDIDRFLEQPPQSLMSKVLYRGWQFHRLSTGAVFATSFTLKVKVNYEFLPIAVV